MYSGIIFFLFNDLHEQIEIKSRFIQNNWNLARSLNTIFILLKIMNIMNITDFDVARNHIKSLSVDTSLSINNDDFIRSNLEIENKLYFIYNQLEDLHRMEKAYPDDQSLWNYLYNYIDCDLVFRQYSDSIYSVLSAKYAKNKTKNNFDLIEEVIKICKSYDFMQLKNVFKIFEEINFKTRNIYNKYRDSFRNAKSLLDSYANEISYDLTVIILFILRPVKERTRENLLYPMEYQNLERYLLNTIA